MDFIPDLPTMLTFTVTCFILFITPGPDMSLVLAKTISGGTRMGIAATLGANAGLCVHTVLAAVGVSAVLAASATAFTVLKIVGGLYLAWLAIDAIRNGSALNVKTEAKGGGSLKRAFLLGLGSDLSNPKVVLFFVTFLPQFVSASDPAAAEKMLFLGFYFVALNVPLLMLLVLGARKLTATLKARPRVLRVIDYIFASVFGAFAVTILRAQAR
jgi:threonine/homoserine/homoserine lactone efflux protein